MDQRGTQTKSKKPVTERDRRDGEVQYFLRADAGRVDSGLT